MDTEPINADMSRAIDELLSNCLASVPVPADLVDVVLLRNSLEDLLNRADAELAKGAAGCTSEGLARILDLGAVAEEFSGILAYAVTAQRVLVTVCEALARRALAMCEVGGFRFEDECSFNLTSEVGISVLLADCDVPERWYSPPAHYQLDDAPF